MLLGLLLSWIFLVSIHFLSHHKNEKDDGTHKPKGGGWIGFYINLDFKNQS